MRLTLVGASALLVCFGLVPAQAAPPAAHLTVSGAPNTRALLHLSRPVVFGDDPFATPQAVGSDGTFAAVVIRDRRENTVFARVIGRVPTSQRPVAIDPLGTARLAPGDYSVELLGVGAPRVKMLVTGLPQDVMLRTSSRARGWLRTAQYGSAPTGGVTVDRVQVPRLTQFLVQVQGSEDTINPHAGAASLCSLIAARCAEVDGFGSTNELSGPLILGVHIVTSGSRSAYFTYAAAQLPAVELISEQDVVTPLKSWRAVLLLG